MPILHLDSPRDRAGQGRPLTPEDRRSYAKNEPKSSGFPHSLGPEKECEQHPAGRHFNSLSQGRIPGWDYLFLSTPFQPRHIPSSCGGHGMGFPGPQNYLKMRNLMQSTQCYHISLNRGERRGRPVLRTPGKKQRQATTRVPWRRNSAGMGGMGGLSHILEPS